MLGKIKNIDWTIIVILLMLAGISIAVIHSAVVDSSDANIANSAVKMIPYYVLGFALVLGMVFFNYKILVKYGLYLYVFGIGVLMLVWSPLGIEINNARGWIKVGVNMQPAEFFKLVLIIAIGAFLVRKNGEKLKFWKDVVPTALIVFVPFIIVMAQNDFGNALCYLVVLIAMLWIGNMKYTQTLIFAVLSGGLLYAAATLYVTYHDAIEDFMTNTLKRGHWLTRLDPILIPGAAGESYHAERALEAIASGGMLGKGYMQGDLSSKVPYTYADSIITVIGEEFGFVGIAILLLLYFILIHRMIVIALECRDRSGPFIIVGIVAMFLYQIFENIGMHVGLMPITGITLPFISYGGTSLLINMASMGVVMSIHVHNQEVIKTEDLLRTDHLDEADKKAERKMRGLKLPDFRFGRTRARGEGK